MSLYAKIAQVQAEIGGVKTDRQANVGQYRYDYLSDSAIFAQVRHRLAPLGVATFVSVESEEQRDLMTVVHVVVTFVDESGEQFSIRSVGYGTDRADKGCGKAITSAVRYAFTKTFLQGGDEDPEQEYIERAPRVNGVAKPAAPAMGEPERVVADQLAALGSDGRKRLKAHMRALDAVKGDQRKPETWVSSIIANWDEEWDQGEGPVYANLARVLEALDAVQRVDTPLERRDAEDAANDAEADALFQAQSPDVRKIPMYGGNAPS